jgi:hypothetical protein
MTPDAKMIEAIIDRAISAKLAEIHIQLAGNPKYMEAGIRAMREGFNPATVEGVIRAHINQDVTVKQHFPQAEPQRKVLAFGGKTK